MYLLILGSGSLNPLYKLAYDVLVGLHDIKIVHFVAS